MSLWGSGASSAATLPIVIDEFGGGHNDDCGPNSNHVLTSWLLNRRPTYAAMDAIRSRDLQRGWFVSGGGQGVYDLYNDVKTYEPSVQVEVAPYIASGYSAAKLRARLADLLRLAQSGQKVGAVVNIQHGGRLPYNQPGVGGHYVALLGFDPATDQVLIGNGDRVPLPKGTGRPDWISVDALAGAQVKGLVSMWVPDDGSGGGQEVTPSGEAGGLGAIVGWLSPARVVKLGLGIVLVGLAVVAVIVGARTDALGALVRK